MPGESRENNVYFGKEMSEAERSGSKIMWHLFGSRRIYRKLNQMIDEAMDGSFEESRYDETELSRLEIRWKRFLGMSKLSYQKIEKERVELKGLVSDISHQVKTPLSNILLYSQMLEESCIQGFSEEQRHSLAELAGEIAKQSEKLDFLMQSLVKLSRLETGIFEFTQEKQEVLPLLAEMKGQAAAGAEAKKIDIILEEMESGQKVSAVFDRKWTAEALGNILDNAVKYSRAHTAVRISVKEYELFACICIEDEGIGISREEIPLLFQRFYRGKEVRQEKGVGLGLSLARQIIEGQQGYIKVASEYGKGTKFFVYLHKELL